jgi:HK97 family phage major capsid protein
MDRTPLTVLLAMIVGIMQMPTDVYDVHAWNAGTVHAAPWRTKVSTGVLRATSAIRSLVDGLWVRRRTVAVVAAIVLALLFPSADAGAGFAIVGIAQLETNLRAKKASALALLEATGRACDAHIVSAATADAPAVTGRQMTADEKAAVQTLLDEAKAIKLQLDGAAGDANMRAEIERLTAGMTGGTGTSDHAPRRETRSLGEQLIADPEYRAWVKSGGSKRNGTWNSPAVELIDNQGMRAATLTTETASGGTLVLPDNLPGFRPLATRRLVVADLIAPGTTDSNLIAFVKELAFTNTAAAVAQGAAKPESSLTFEAATAAVKKIAHWMAVTSEMLEDYAQTQSVVDARLRLGLDLTEEDQLLNGSGIGANQLGLMNLVGLSAAQPRGADTNADAIIKQISAITIATFMMPDAFIMNPANWLTIQLTKNAAGNYLGSGPWAPAQPAQLWGLPGAITPSIVANTALVGAFKSAAQFFRKGGVRVEATNSHSDFFIKNLVAILAEERGALVSYRDAAFGKVTGLN